MDTKKMVKIQLISRCDGEEAVHHYDGELYLKQSRVFVRYQEAESELGRTVTLLKPQPHSIQIVRQGDVQSDQMFMAGERRSAVYRMPHGSWVLDAETHYIEYGLENGIGSLRWSYDLYVSGQAAGRYEIEMKIQEG